MPHRSGSAAGLADARPECWRGRCKTAARKLRGIDAAVTAGAGTVEVKFGHPEPDNLYSLCVQPNWLTATAVKEKRADGFRVEFAAPAPAGARIDWQLIR